MPILLRTNFQLVLLFLLGESFSHARDFVNLHEEVVFTLEDVAFTLEDGELTPAGRPGR